MKRRGFFAACTAACTAQALSALAEADLRPRLYRRALLVDGNDAPLRADSIARQRNFIFHYPYSATPCFLLNLGKPVAGSVSLKTVGARSYDWPGGVGPQRSLVAYSAICAHKLAYPTREISFIRYRAELTPHSTLSKVIHCCSEHSQYDPAQGARVLAGPAPQPLAAILLEYDSNRDELHAVGTLGGEMFNDFFSKYAFRLTMEYGPDRAHREVGERVKVVELENYSRQQMQC